MAFIAEHISPPLPLVDGTKGGKRPIQMVTCIIRAEKLESVTNALNKLNLVGGMTVTDIRGVGHESPGEGVFLGRKFTHTYIPRVKIELVIEVSDLGDVENVISTLARTGEVGDGKVFVTKVMDAMRIRTGEKGAAAL